MINKLRYGLIAALAIVALFSCNPIDIDPENEASLTLRQTEVGPKASSIFLQVTAKSSWTLTLETPDGSLPWAELSQTSGTGDTFGIILSYETNITDEDRSIDIVLTAGTSSAKRYTLIQKGISEQRPDPDPEPDPTVVPNWLELPAVDNDLDYYRHFFNYNGKSYRNYSIGWDKDALVAHWVAYPLCSFYTKKNVDRTDAWGYDPAVPTSEQPEMFHGVSGYDRGHQMPSADRLVCREANVQTFYFTNMTPQLGALNQKIWANFEGDVRSWSSSSDTLYVVTGCIIEGSNKKAYDNVGKQITVPVGYFKACLRYSKSSTIGFGGYSAVAVYLEHRRYTEQSVDRSMSMSIDELEEKTGIDFFVNLSSVVGSDAAARIEAQDPKTVDWWW